MMTKIIIISVVVAVLCRGIGLWLPRSPAGRFFNRIYHLLASAIKSASGGAIRLGKYLGSKTHGPR